MPLEPFVQLLHLALRNPQSFPDAERHRALAVVEQLPQLVSGGLPQDADLQDVALRMTDFNLFAVGVTDDDDRLIGAISVDDLLDNVVPEEWRRRAEVSSSD